MLLSHWDRAHSPTSCRCLLTWTWSQAPQRLECGPHLRPLALHSGIFPTALIPRTHYTFQCALSAFTPACRLCLLFFVLWSSAWLMAALSKRPWDQSVDHGGKCAYHSGTRACRLCAWEIYNNSAIDSGLQIGGVGRGLGWVYQGLSKGRLCTLGARICPSVY